MHCIIIFAERSALIQEAIEEAKSHAEQRAYEVKAKSQAATMGCERIRARHYKQVTKEARRQGEARQLFENMVHRAERKLAEAQRKSHAGVQSAEARAEELATELFHRPGSMLTNEEIAQMMTGSECRGREEEEVLVCHTPTFNRFRTIDGTCNNLEHPLLGAADTALTRLIPSQYEDGISSLRGSIQNRHGGIFNKTAFQPPSPSPRHISETIIRDIPNDEKLTHMLMQFGQFIDHDLSLSPEMEDDCDKKVENCEFTDVCEPIRVTDLDPKFGLGTPNNGACIAFSRSFATCANPNDTQVNRGIFPREQINVLTSYIDGSMIYGSDRELANRIRAFTGGLLTEGDAQQGKKAELPRIFPADNMRSDGEPFVGCPEGNEGALGCFLAGEFRVNEQVVLSVMHTVWLREHNRVARELAQINPSWGDERLYQEARKIVGAILQKIVYYDYLPKIFGKRVYNIVVGEFGGYDPRINAGVNNAFATAAYRYGHTLIRPFFDRLGSDYNNIAAGPLELSQVFFNPDQFRTSFGTDPLTRGLISQRARRVDEFLSTVLTSNLFRSHLDLASLNIQRGRDHGLPPYLTWRRYCAEVFPELAPAEFENTLTYIRLLELYGSLDTVDLWVGGLAEKREKGSLLGPTFACLFGITFANVRDGDRFYYKVPGIFSPEQVASIEQHSLAAVICDNSDSITDLQQDVFLSGQHVPCSDIPRINLQLWAENMCHFRVDIPPRGFSVPVRSYSRAVQPNYSFFAKAVNANDATVSVCVPVVCPSDTVDTDVVIYLSPFLDSFVRLVPNSVIPPSTLSSGRYRADWSPKLFDRRGTGVYRSQAACERRGAAAALVVEFRSMAQEMDANTNNALAAQANKQPDANSPNSNEEIPDDILAILLGLDNAPTTTTTTTKAEEEEEYSDAQLMSDLEDALRSLQN